MHSYLASSAVDGVKVDCQAGVGLVGSALGGGPAAAREFQAALEESIATHFPGNHAINCMCHSSENFYRWVLMMICDVMMALYWSCCCLAVFIAIAKAKLLHKASCTRLRCDPSSMLSASACCRYLLYSTTSWLLQNALLWLTCQV
jgi:hypothetical protein